MQKYIDILASGDLVGLPTETVYGLAADATNSKAVAKIFLQKNRPGFNPLIVHVTDISAAHDFAIVNPVYEPHLEDLWPGPLTVIFPVRPHSAISPLVTAGLNTVAVRIPKHDLALKILCAYGKPLAAPSGNISGKVSPVLATHVEKYFPNIPVLDGGACAVGVESTILDLSSRTPTVLRPGGMEIEALEEKFNVHIASGETPDTIIAPGQLSRHYAPDVPIRLNVLTPNDDEIFIGFGEIESDYNLSVQGSLEEAAANLFSLLHLLSTQKAPAAIYPIPMHGLGRAINDRLQRAACQEEHNVQRVRKR